MDNMENEKLNKEREKKLREAAKGNTGNAGNAKYDDAGNRITSRQWITDADGKESYVEKDKHGTILNDNKPDNKRRGNGDVEGKKQHNKKRSKLDDIKGLKKDISNIKSKNKSNKKDNKIKKTAKGAIRTLSLMKVIIIFSVTHIWFTLTMGILTIFIILGALTAVGETTGDYYTDYITNNGGSYGGGSGKIPYIDGKYKIYMPIRENTTVTSLFGYREMSGELRQYSDHKGLDLDTINYAPGTNIYAALPGVVEVASKFSPLPSSVNDKAEGSTGDHKRGQYVAIRHDIDGQAIYTVYMHLYRVNVKNGDVVGVNDIIGIGGNTGPSNGAHLHLELRVGSVTGQALNPAHYIMCGNTNLNRIGAKTDGCFDYRE